MFLFKRNKKVDETNSINNDYELPEKEVNTQQIRMVCCDTTFNIDQLFNKSLCPNCNTQLKYIIESNTEPCKTNEIEEIEKIIPDTYENENINYIEILFPIYVFIGSMIFASVFYIQSNV